MQEVYSRRINIQHRLVYSVDPAAMLCMCSGYGRITSEAAVQDSRAFCLDLPEKICKAGLLAKLSRPPSFPESRHEESPPDRSLSYSPDFSFRFRSIIRLSVR